LQLTCVSNKPMNFSIYLNAFASRSW